MLDGIGLGGGAHFVVGEVAADLVDPRLGDLHAGVVVDRANDFFGVPCEPDFAFGLTGGEQTEESLAAVDAQAFFGYDESGGGSGRAGRRGGIGA